jgi:hypothetical protein
VGILCFAGISVKFRREFRQIEVHTAEPLVSDPSTFEVEIAIARLKRYCDMYTGYFF